MKKFTMLLVCLAMFGIHVANAQQRTITGTVTSAEDGMGLPGVSVSVKGTTLGAATDIDGKYALNVPQDAQILVFSSVGMQTQEITIGASNNISVAMKPSTVDLGDVVVMGYVSQSKSEVTGSAVQVSAEEIADMPVATVDQALQGKVAGVNVSGTSGTPGASQQIRIRGRSSITAGNAPLYVIDGVPMISGDVLSTASTGASSLSSIASLNNSDIESVTVLKDASATAAYGARGANGVIIITTKSGRAGKANFNFKASYGFSNDAVEGPKILTGAQVEELTYEAIKNTYSNHPRYTGDPKLFYETYINNQYVNWHANGAKEANWDKVITNQNAPMQEYNLSASGGDEKSNYFISMGYFGQEATVIGSEFKRYSGKVNFSRDLIESITFRTNNSASHSDQHGLLEQSAYFSSPRTAKFFMRPILSPYKKDGSYSLNSRRELNMPNPLYVAENNMNDSKYTRIISNNLIEWRTPIKDLKYSFRGNIDYNSYNYKNYQNPVEGDGRDVGGRGWQVSRTFSVFVVQNALDYTFRLSDDHKFDFKLLQEYQTSRSYDLEAEGTQFGDEGLTNLNNVASPSSLGSSFSDWKIGSYLAMVHYSAFKGKYVADLTYRREGSSRFGKKNRWGNFYAIGAAWNIHKESFLSDLDFLTHLKLRVAYGVTGNANIPVNQYQALAAYNAAYDGKGAAYLSTLGNSDLSWEKSHTFDVGLDFGVLQDRIKGSIGYYRRESKDLLLNVPLSFTVGYLRGGTVRQTRNLGRMENSGIELNLEFDIVRNEDFNITLGGNMATNQNKVLELAKDLKGNDINITTNHQRVEVGHPVYGWYMRTWAGVNPDTGVDEWFDKDGNKTTTYNEGKVEWQGGSALPTLTAGMNFHADFKGVFLDVNGYFATGHKVYEDWHRYVNESTLFPVHVYNGFATLLDRWQKPGDNARNAKFKYGTNPWQNHSKYLHDGTFFRLRDVTLGYDFDKELVGKIGLGAARIFARGTNLFTWVKAPYLVHDPEVDVGGFTSLTTPPVKSIIFGINIKF